MTRASSAAAAAKKPLTVSVPATVRDEIQALARTAGRSVAFLVQRALTAAAKAPPVPVPPGASSPLVLSADDEDPPDTLARLRGVDGERVAAAWMASRARFLAWAARLETADRATRADDLDDGLRDAAAPDTAPARLVELARSEYPRVRALVAAHPATPRDALATLAADRDRFVRAAVAAR